VRLLETSTIPEDSRARFLVPVRDDSVVDLDWETAWESEATLLEEPEVDGRTVVWWAELGGIGLVSASDPLPKIHYWQNKCFSSIPDPVFKPETSSRWLEASPTSSRLRTTPPSSNHWASLASNVRFATQTTIEPTSLFDRSTKVPLDHKNLKIPPKGLEPFHSSHLARHHCCPPMATPSKPKLLLSHLGKHSPA